MIQRLNDDFVCTWTIIDDAQQAAKQGDALAKTLAQNWKFPLDFVFLNSDGRLINKLNSFQDLKSAHPDVGHPPEGRGRSASHFEVFHKHLDRLAEQAKP